ncbi:response regulator transcription factor [Chondrinema litorale]|uniref:response regulator transcription factor n=1 Tax=Chondrinema litorale TaxID=2994555 RepID=UPI0025438FAC|nr:LuxR C-terminal-related transcriptional regulator [Chondrinema litorale]UZS00119.1 LuxR C-terminal-related transcriptional regulator [Chondrinema litorale]
MRQHRFIKASEEEVELLKAIELLLEGRKYFGRENNTVSRRKYCFKDYILTQREREIVRLISRGDTSPEIGEKLSNSKHTVLTHRKNTLSKLNLKNGSQLVRYAINWGGG